MPYPINASHKLLLETGDKILLEDNSSFIIMDEGTALDDPLNAATPASVTPALTFVGQNPFPPLPRRLQVTTNHSNAFASTISATFPNALTPGSTILVAWEGDLSTTVANTPTDLAGLTYARQANIAGVNTGVKLEVWSASNSTSTYAGNVITITDNGAGVKNGIVVEEWANLLNGTVDQTAGVDSLSSTLADSGATSTLAQANELVWVAAVSGNAANSFSNFPDYSTISQDVNTSPTNIGVSSTLVNNTAAVHGFMRLAVNNWSIIVCTFKAASTVGSNLSYEVQVDTVNTFDSQ